MKINIGCGKRKYENFINCDIDERVKPDLLFDISQGWPFLANSIDHIAAANVLEHIEADKLVGTMREVHRVLKAGGTFKAMVPYWTGRWAVSDFRHKTFWNEYLLRWFCDATFMDKAIAKDIDFEFDLTELVYKYLPGVEEHWPTAEERKFPQLHYLNVVDSMVFTLRKPSAAGKPE